MNSPLLTIGKIINTRGLQGEVKIASLTDFPFLRYRKGNTVYLEQGQSMIPLVVKQAHHQPGFDFVQFHNFSDINLVKNWMNLFLYAPKEDIRLKVGHYFYEDLVGLTIIDDIHGPIGDVIKVESIAQRLNLRVKLFTGERTLQIPFVDAFIQSVSLKEKKIHVHLIEGML